MSQSPNLLTNIINEQNKQIAETKRQQQRHLDAIQTEERAIEELLIAYGAHTTMDEYITVERVSKQTLAPVWSARV